MIHDFCAGFMEVWPSAHFAGQATAVILLSFIGTLIILGLVILLPDPPSKSDTEETERP